jgi:hypothetical protein
VVDSKEDDNLEKKSEEKIQGAVEVMESGQVVEQTVGDEGRPTDDASPDGDAHSDDNSDGEMFSDTVTPDDRNEGSGGSGSESGDEKGSERDADEEVRDAQETRFSDTLQSPFLSPSLLAATTSYPSSPPPLSLSPPPSPMTASSPSTPHRSPPPSHSLESRSPQSSQNSFYPYLTSQVCVPLWLRMEFNVIDVAEVCIWHLLFFRFNWKFFSLFDTLPSVSREGAFSHSLLRTIRIADEHNRQEKRKRRDFVFGCCGCLPRCFAFFWYISLMHSIFEEIGNENEKSDEKTADRTCLPGRSCSSM